MIQVGNKSLIMPKVFVYYPSHYPCLKYKEILQCYKYYISISNYFVITTNLDSGTCDNKSISSIKHILLCNTVGLQVGFRDNVVSS